MITPLRRPSFVHARPRAVDPRLLAQYQELLRRKALALRQQHLARIAQALRKPAIKPITPGDRTVAQQALTIAEKIPVYGQVISGAMAAGQALAGALGFGPGQFDPNDDPDAAGLLADVKRQIRAQVLAADSTGNPQMQAVQQQVRANMATNYGKNIPVGTMGTPWSRLLPRLPQ